MEPTRCFFTTEVVRYPERDAYGYKLKAVGLEDTFTILVSPGIYDTSDAALAAAIRDAHRLRGNMAARSARLRKNETYKYLEPLNPNGAA